MKFNQVDDSRNRSKEATVFSWLDLKEEPAYSPQMYAALAVYFGQILLGKKIETRKLAEVAGVTHTALCRNIKKIEESIGRVLLQIGSED